MAIDWNTAALPAVMDRESAAGIEQEATDGHARRERAERFGRPDEGADTSQPVEGGDARITADLPERERNHRIGNEPLVPAGQVGKIKGNLRAMEMLRALGNEGRHPTAAEKQILAQYTGWGHSPQVFDEIKAGYWKAHLEGECSYGYKHDPEGLKHWAGKFYEHHQALRELLTPAEWSRAEASTLNAHYTSREVIEHGLWAAALHLGFKGGRVLENSAGIGHVIGLVPDNIAESCHFTACELDTISGRMLKLLYPQATVHITAFQDARIAPDSQDLTIGNFPFNKEGWSGDQYPFSLHNQFFARSLDLTAPGGLIVAITSNSTMDSPASTTFRRWMAQRADLLGAIRLPNNTFKKNAGTEVTTDILVFRKHDGQSANITTGRGLAESVSRRIAELEDEAGRRDRIAETKRRRIVELEGLQGRSFTHAAELAQHRQRLEAVKDELEKSTNAKASNDDGGDAATLDGEEEKVAGLV